MAELRSPKPSVAGSSPVSPAKYTRKRTPSSATVFVCNQEVIFMPQIVTKKSDDEEDIVEDFEDEEEEISRPCRF